MFLNAALTLITPQEKHDFLNRLVENMMIKETIGKILRNLSALYNKHNLDSQNQKKNKEQLLLEIEELLEFLILATESPLCRAFLKNRSHIMIPIFKYSIENIVPYFETEYFYLSSLFTLYSNLLIKEFEKEENLIAEYVSLNYLTEIFTTMGTILTRHNTKYINFKKSALAFTSNFLVMQKPRNYCLVQLISASKNINADILPLEKAEKSPGLFFLQNLILDSSRILDVSVAAREHFAINTRRYLDNMSGIFLNILHGYNDKNILVNIIQVLNEKNITVMSSKLVLTLMKYKDSFNMFEMSLARAITLFARFYTSSYEGKNTEELVKMLIELYPYFEAEGEATKLAKPVTGELTKLIVTFL